MREQQILDFASASTQEISWDGGKGLVSVSAAGVGVVTKLQYRHGSADSWKDVASATVTNDGQFTFEAMPATDNYSLAINTSAGDGTAHVVIGRL